MTNKSQVTNKDDKTEKTPTSPISGKEGLGRMITDKVGKGMLKKGMSDQ